ncbi:MAG: aminotransferase class I/II-fold pyridoxal phosphate-dependent enzyme [Planctomycetes bacterium]|nr:aminotransferase class I/II-fold pyridoxal phosphate-dependent enzyme [Planctomycetota bacterium]
MSRLERDAAEALARLTAASLRREVTPPRGVDFASNDYLGLRDDPRVLAAAHAALDREGLGAGAARLLRGDSPSLRALEERMAAAFRAPDALAFPSGFHANYGVVAALAPEGWSVASDAQNHASIVDGCRAARARTVVVPHGDVEAFARAVADERTLAVVEHVYSMSGDVAPVAALSDACARSGAALVVDEAHAVGLLPPAGRPALRVVPCGKALGASGAVVTGPKDVLDLLRSTCRTFLFTTALAPALAAGAAAALELALAEPWRGERALALARRLHPGARAAIVSVPCRDNADALAAQAFLAERGLDVRAVRPPTVPHAALRISVHATRTDAEVDRLADALDAWRRRAAP